MGEENRDRQLRRARATYIGAAGRLSKTLEAFDESGMPMNPIDDGPPPWTDEHKRILAALPRAAADVIDAWRAWDGMRREWRGR
jgi:hypothetical protein